jgi:hypothetical protein
VWLVDGNDEEQAAELAFSAFQRVIWATDTALRVTKRVIVGCDSFSLHNFSLDDWLIVLREGSTIH